MSAFTVYLDPDGYGALPQALDLRVINYRSSVQGGPLTAEIEATGQADALWECLTWLRRGVEIYDNYGTRQWWGLVNAVRLSMGYCTIGLSLDEMFNRAAVAYTYESADGSQASGTTSWSENATSVSRYGTKELLYSLGSGEENGANAKRLELLTNYANPGRTLALEQGRVAATLSCVGWWETLAWKYFQRLEGRLEWEGDGEDYDQAVGWGLTGSKIGFAGGAIHDVDGKLSALREGDKIVVSGSSAPANNRTFTVNAEADGDAYTLVDNDIGFDYRDDIGSSRGLLGFIRADNFIRVQGSPLNSRYHLIDSTGADHCTTQYTATGTLATEGGGATITITQGHKVSLAEGVAFELPAASTVTIRQYGYECAQSFVPTHAFTVDKIAVKVGKVGSPIDNLELSICADLAGAPGTALLTGTLAPAALDENAGWIWVDVANTLSLVASTTYWLKIRRTSTLDADNYYVVEMVLDGGYGGCLAYKGVGWSPHPQSATIPFKIWGAEDTISQIRRILTDDGQFFAGVDLQLSASGVLTNQYIDNDQSALDEARKLLALGTSSGKRVLVEVTAERVARIYEEPSAGSALDRWLQDGMIRQATGGPRPRGRLPVGEWLAIEGIPLGINATLGLSPQFVDEAEYSVENDELRLDFKSVRREGVRQG